MCDSDSDYTISICVWNGVDFLVMLWFSGVFCVWMRWTSLLESPDGGENSGWLVEEEILRDRVDRLPG